jgi:hypothetical protein
MDIWWVYVWFMFLYCGCDRVGQLGERGSLRREGRGECCGYSEVWRLCWPQLHALSCVLIACQVLWGLVSRVAFVTTLSNRTSLLHVVLLLFGGRMRQRANTSSREQGSDFDLVGTCEWLSYVRGSGSQAYAVLVRFFPLHGVHRFESPWHSRLWVAACPL